MDIVDIYNTMKSQYLYSNSLLKKLSIVMVVFCAFTCYLPVILNYKLAVDENELENRLHTRFFLDALVCAIAVSFPMICDAVMDTELSWEFTLPRWVFVSALFIPSLTIYIPLNLGYRIAPLFICAYQARACLYTGTLLSFMIETGRSTLWAYGMFLTTVFLVVVVNMGAWRPFFAAPDSFLAIVWVLAMIVCAAIFFCSYVYLIADNMLGQVFDMTNNLSTSRRCATLYIFFLTCSLVIKTAIFMANNAQPTTETTLGVVLTLYVDVITVTVSFIVPGRIARFESLITRLQLDKKKDFVRYISHEIRTPLNTVTMGVELALSRLLKDFSKDDVAEILESVAESSDTAVGILDDLLLFDKLEEGKVVLEQRLVKLRDLLNSCVSPFYVQALQKSIQLTFSLQNGCTDCSLRDLSELLVDVDIKKMSQVVRNLVSNAIKFTPSGGEVNVCVFYEPYLDSDSKEQSCTFIPPVDDVSVSTTTSFDIEQPCTSTSSSSQYRKLCSKKRNTGRLRIEVRDTGPGISLENQRKLFTQIIQFNAAELQGGGGSGLGLFISKSIVERHNGSIAVHSEGVPGKGCVFSIDLEARTTPPRGREVVDLSPPREAFVVRQMSEPEASSDNEMSETDHSKLESGKRALVVDDSPLNRKMLVSILKMWFPTIDEAENGEESVKAVKTSQERGKPYDIIFMDNVMPVMDGVEATAAIRALGVRAPIIAVTGNVLPVDRTLMMDAGVNSIATKPLRLQQLEEILLSTKISSVPRVSAKENRGGLGSKSDSGRSIETPPSLSQKHESDPQTKYVEMAVINTPKALVVDDSLMNRKMLVSMLKSWYTVIDQAADGSEALRSVQESLASASPYDIIFMDGVMPTMGGIETTEAIRSLGVSTPIVAVTGNVSAEDRDAMLAAGVNIVASKPIRLQRVEEILKEVKKI